jgi:hypothetical protein
VGKAADTKNRPAQEKTEAGGVDADEGVLPAMTAMQAKLELA